MAVLAPTDWHPPRDLSMDASTNAINTSVPRQRSSPANDHSASSTPPSQQPYPYPVQQQQAGWQSPHPQQQYYPSFYPNHHQQAYQLHAHPGQGQMHAQSPYYDPANAQFAQWAYQQMMFNAHQAHQMSHVPSPQHTGQRSRSASASTGEYFVPPQVPGYNPFPSGTPPAHPSQLPNAYNSPPSDQSPHQSQYNGYHPYRRPNRQGSQHQDPSQATPSGDWRGGPFQPPYARTDAAGSSTSVNSASSHSGSSRHRTNSLQGSSAPSANSTKSPPPAGSVRGSSGAGSNSSTLPAAPRPHQRTGSAVSNASSAVSRPSVASSSTNSSASAAPAAARKPSPLSQGNFTAAEKRMSRDDSDLAAMLEPTPGVRSGGLKGRLRRALSLNAATTLHEEDEDEQGTNGSRRTAVASSSSSAVLGDDESTATVQKKKSKSLFNSRLNRSTDNISLSSTMSSASMVIRKLGNLGKLTRRNSLAGITSLFKDKKDKEGGEDGKKGKKKKDKDGKGQVSEPSVSLATAELDPAEWSPEMNGLSPAARLARQHTLKSNAEAAAKAKAEQEAKAKAAAANAAQSAGAVPGPWEKNTTTRQAENSHGKGLTRINEDGSKVIVEDDDSDSEDGHNGQGMYHHHMEGWEEDDDDWGEAQDEDVTIRQSLDAVRLDDEEMEPWAINIRRSEERTRKPAKGILKNGTNYDQDTYAARSAQLGRHRANSYDSTPSHAPELGPLAHIPSPDPDHIDGLHKHSHLNTQTPFLPPLSFDSKGLTAESPKDSDTSTVRAPSPAEKTFFSHPNSSAPALSTMFTTNPPTLTQRSATAPAKRLAFATNLSVYDTFPAAVYDRRSEPATWSRLTPTLAQRIKEELNSYKMEEMEVHAASRVHTQFFV
ncbi:hypothetical protein BDY19DRAFT_992838 [Irpex rosettiformis]|uniref:Uncharacterized protein n=1 Tax=Irpex rosettiformis TaxID=378272 RepID=A0ACB8U675_9APHY|nr:hypothetical protein BDY19DRAFT_992838 [Irpex rosettiformis]